MHSFKIYAIFLAFTHIHGTAGKSAAFENTENEFECSTKCTCTEERLSDVPIMKWLTIPMNRKTNVTRKDNNVLDDDEEEDLILEQDPFIFAAFCNQQDSASNIEREEFSPTVEAMTLLYGPDTSNKTIVHELDKFRDLIILDMQGYEPKSMSPLNYSEIQLHHEALLELHHLRYLNIQYIRIFPHSNVTRPENNTTRFNQSESSQPSNLTYLPLDEVEIMPYEEFKKQQSVVSIFSRLTDLQFLRLFHCHINSITWETFIGLHNLRMLSLGNNDITELPEFVFYHTPQLQSLILSRNKISRIVTESFAGLPHLEHLDLSGNQLKTLSELTFAPLPKLYSLDLLGNPLEDLSSDTFETMNDTRNLWIGSTEGFIVQEDAFSALNQLEKLTLLGLNASKLHKDMLRGLTNLKHIRVSGNIESLVFDTFTGSLLLEELILRHCSLKSISVDAFYGLRYLKRLDLSRNKLQTLQPGIFDQLYSLKELILARNHFITLPKLVLANLQHVDMIRLEANPWNCSCDMIEWGSLNLNKKKVMKTIEQPCNYQYDKIPCTSIQMEVYEHDPKATPKCSTPSEYEGWNILRAVYTNMECQDGEKSLPKKYPKLKKIKKKILSATVTHEEAMNTATTILTERIQSRQDEDNNLGDLSPYYSVDNGLIFGNISSTS